MTFKGSFRPKPFCDCMILDRVKSIVVFDCIIVLYSMLMSWKFQIVLLIFSEPLVVSSTQFLSLVVEKALKLLGVPTDSVVLFSHKFFFNWLEII